MRRKIAFVLAIGVTISVFASVLVWNLFMEKVEPDNPKRELTSVAATREFFSSVDQHPAAQRYDKLIGAYENCEEVESGANVFLEAPPIVGEEDDWLEVICYLSDRRVDRATRRIQHIVVKDGSLRRSLFELLGSDSTVSTKRSRWASVRVTAHHFERSDTSLVIVFR